MAFEPYFPSIFQRIPTHLIGPKFKAHWLCPSLLVSQSSQKARQRWRRGYSPCCHPERPSRMVRILRQGSAQLGEHCSLVSFSNSTKKERKKKGLFVHEILEMVLDSHLHGHISLDRVTGEATLFQDG